VQQLGEDGLVVAAAPRDTVTLRVAIDAVLDSAGTMRGGAGVTFVAPAEPGVYGLHRAGRQVGALVVNSQVEESNVDGWGTAVWQDEWVGRRAEIVRADGAVSRAVFDRAGGRSIVWPLLVLALVALLAEALVARGWLAGREATDGGSAAGPLPLSGAR
jgi:hypothetical protein